VDIGRRDCHSKGRRHQHKQKTAQKNTSPRDRTRFRPANLASGYSMPQFV
jgi:hypothetical protein